MCPSDHKRQVEVNLRVFKHLLYFHPSSLDSKFLWSLQRILKVVYNINHDNISFHLNHIHVDVNIQGLVMFYGRGLG